HRDLKPDNILVNPQGDPKVLDFGVASIGQEAAVSVTTVTHTGQILGTFAYMAPEVLSATGNLNDPRIDVYALGVIGFELLCGRKPVELGNSSMAAAIRALEMETTTRLGSVDRTFRGDVDTIIGKAMEKEPQRRYPSAAALADDIRRYLSARPILARPPSRSYRLRTFARRNRMLVGGVLATFLALLLGLIVAATFGLRADQQRRVAETREVESARNEAMAARGLLLAAQRFRDDGREWDALQQLQLIPPNRRNWEWYHIARRLPFVIDGAPNETFLQWIDDDHFITTNAWLRQNQQATGLRCYDVHDPDHYEVLFPDLQCNGIGAPSRGPRILVRQGGDTMIDLDAAAGQILDQWTIPDAGQINLGPREHAYFNRHGPNTIEYYRRDVQPFTFDIRPVWPSFAFHPTEPLALVANQVGVTSALDLEHGTILRTESLSRNRISSIDMHPSGAFFAIADGHDFISLRDPYTFEELRRIGPQPGGIVPCFSPDGTLLVVSSNTDHSIRIWDVETGELRHRHDHGRSDEAHRVQFSPGSRWVTDHQRNERYPVLINLDPRTWDPPAFTELRGHTGWIYPIALSNDGHLLISGAPTDPDMRLWDVVAGRQLARIPWSINPIGDAMSACMAFTADDREVLVTARAPSGELALLRCDLATGTRTWTPIQGGYWASVDVIRDALGPDFHGPLNEYVHVRRNGDLIKSRPWDGSNEMFVDLASGEQITLSTSHWDCGSIAVDPDDHTMVFASLRRLFATTSYGEEQEWIFEARSEGVRGMAYSPDGSRLALGTDDGRIMILDTRFMLKVCEWQAHPTDSRYHYVWALRWTPDGSRLISSSGDGTIRIWDSQREFMAIERRDAWDALRQRMRNADQQGTVDETTLTPEEAAALRSIRIEQWAAPDTPPDPDPPASAGNDAA
ncbi:MAG: protein kinase, partial [Phycisphaerales bacterium]|nr:protein kinase [Phycisphaerales bacterium]